MKIDKIFIASDHAGYETKENVKKLYLFIKNNNIDFSTLFPGYSGVVEYLKYDSIFESN